ncbi:MAG: hypothetical protein WA058_00245 [Minisyncoccia bacterium]
MDTGIGVWIEARAASGSKPSEIVGYYDHSFTDAIGIYATVVVASDRYGEFYVGPKVELTKWLQVGVGFGREIMPGMANSARRNVWVAIDTDKAWLYAAREDGGSGPWHKVIGLYKATDTISVGGMYETLLGIGPRVEYAVAKNVVVWGALLRDRDTRETTTLLAVNFSF